MESGEQVGSAGVSKWDIRHKIWDYMEANNLADFPRPVHHRIPNFKGSFQMNGSIQACDVFDIAGEVKVDPDKPLEGIRLAVLQGVRDYSVPVGLDAKVHVDLVVVGSVAVSEKGWRIGKGEGFADMEYAMMASMGAVKEDTIIVTAVHDCQVVDIPEELLGDHDLTVDYILTPTRAIKTGCKRPKPRGILWHEISHETLIKIPILKSLRYREKQEGKDVILKDEQPDVPVADKPAARVARKSRLESPGLQGETSLTPASPGNESLVGKSDRPDAPATVYVGNIAQGTRVSELKDALREHRASPTRLTWHGAQHQAFLSYDNKSAADDAVAALQGLSLRGSPLRVELARNQCSRRAHRPR
ncbi:methenyltetrahydrofolate synthase domain-containing protein isoform X3 [Elgaria multicarinata webbii]|uniref:methenyltetrahydrofolate synthase domain-containing protein isoform X3 n=1 Tax=Elgaria multicarinata webbii TaxID=159646 RepID=UPI002FCD2677